MTVQYMVSLMQLAASRHCLHTQPAKVIQASSLYKLNYASAQPHVIWTSNSHSATPTSPINYSPYLWTATYYMCINSLCIIYLLGGLTLWCTNIPSTSNTSATAEPPVSRYPVTLWPSQTAGDKTKTRWLGKATQSCSLTPCVKTSQIRYFLLLRYVLNMLTYHAFSYEALVVPGSQRARGSQ